MIVFSTQATPSTADVAEQLCEEPEDFALVLSGIAAMIEDEQREELEAELAGLPAHDRKAVVDLLLRLLAACDGLKTALGACVEAE
jgi:DNA-directed RNA polymerase specialized sigma24 family protein